MGKISKSTAIFVGLLGIWIFSELVKFSDNEVNPPTEPIRPEPKSRYKNEPPNEPQK